MDANNSPEQNPPEKSMEQQAQEAADRAVAQVRQIQKSYESQFAELENIQDDGERARARALLAQEAKVRLSEEINRHTTVSAEPGQADKPEDIKEKANNARKLFLEVKELNKEKVNVIDSNSQLLVDKIVEKIKSGEITDSSILAIERFLGKELIDGVVFSKANEQLSTTEEGLINLIKIDPQSANFIYETVASNPETYSTTADILRQKIIGSTPENSVYSQNQQEDEYSKKPEIQSEMKEAGYGHAEGYYLGRFTQDQMDIIKAFYSPTAFVEYLEDLSERARDGKKDPIEVLKEKNEIKEHIEHYYKTNHKDFEPGDSLEKQVEKHWGEIVSEKMNWKVSDVINQLFLELQSKSPHKFYEEIMQGDPLYGPQAIQLRIQAALNSLMTKIVQKEKDESDPLYQRLEKLNLYRHAEQDRIIDERDGKTYPRLKPIPYGKRISTSDFIKYVGSTIDHTIHKAEYFHNSRAIYGHPAGEKGFYNQLGGFAEGLKGTDIDEILMLPDGQHIMQAYQLYEKMLEEDFAKLDWRHRPDQFQNELEKVNSKLEGEIIKQLKDFYPDLSETRITNILNSAVGISRGMTLTESEKSAYADPVDSEGNGMVASYSTNDAASLNVFNPLHTALRWQGEHNWNMMYFMPVAGQPGKMWDHTKAWGNMARYMDTFIAGKGRGAGKDKLPRLFADAMMDINDVGGPNKRKGWRMDYSFDGHYVWDDDNTINAPKTFKAMEAIGYEAIAHMLSNDKMWSKLLEATDRSAPEQVKERTELFSYIYRRYFSPDPEKYQESDLDNYLSKLKVKAEENAMKKIKENGSLEQDSWEKQIAYETSKLFLENTKAHYVASRMPTKFLRIDRNRFTENGVSHWERIYREINKDKGWDRERFDVTMKDLIMTEMLLRRQISEKIREEISFDKEWTLDRSDKIKDLPFRLDEEGIRKLLKNKYKSEDGYKSQEEIQRVVDLWNHINNDFNTSKFLDSKGAEKIEEYKFTFGLEDTDMSLIAYRGTGPRMIARAIKDIGGIEAAVTPWISNMPQIMNEVAISGKHDFSPIIEYLRKAQKAIFDVHGTDPAQKFIYEMSGTIINYFKKDGMAKPLFGLLRLGKINSMAAEYAGRFSAVWEWDSRDIDRYCVALESYRLLPHNPYDLNKTERGKLDKKTGKWIEGKFTGGELEDRWIKLPGLKPFKFGKKRHIDWEYNGAKLRKEHGADRKAIGWDMVNQFIPLAMAFLLWKYIKDAMDEASGKKKQ